MGIHLTLPGLDLREPSGDFEHLRSEAVELQRPPMGLDILYRSLQCRVFFVLAKTGAQDAGGLIAMAASLSLSSSEHHIHQWTSRYARKAVSP